MKKFFSLSILLLLAFVAGFSSCKFTSGQTDGGTQTQLDSIQVEKVYHLLDNPNNPNCNLVINFTYPADCAEKAVLPTLQKQFILAYFGEDYENMTPQEAVSNYVKHYLEEYKELEPTYKKDVEENETPGSWYSYYEMSSNTIQYNSEYLLSFTVCFENYTGGAHGAHSYTNFTLNAKTGERITESDLFNEGFEDSLAQLLIGEIAKKNQVTDPKDLEDMGYFSVDEIYPNNNFYIDETGLTYTFNEYEIAAYALGETEVHLSFDQLRGLLKADCPILKWI